MLKRFPWKVILAAAGLVLIVFLLMDLNQRLDRMHRLADQVATVEVESTQVSQTQQALGTAIGYATSDVAVGEWAYANGMAQDDETLVRLIPGSGATATPAPQAEPVKPVILNWQVWRELFFGH